MKILIIRNLLLAITILIWFDAYCCTCLGESTVKSELKNSDVVFVGKVISTESFTVSHHILKTHKRDFIRTYFNVEYYWKGKRFTTNISIVSGMGRGDCGFVFNKDQRYLVYANKRENYYEGSPGKSIYFFTDICFRTTNLIATEEEELEKIKRIKKRYP